MTTEAYSAGAARGRIAAAPISFGVFGDIRLDMAPDQLVSAIAETGHTGSELGPPGFFGPASGLRGLFADAGVVPVAAYAPLHLVGGEETFAADLAQLRATLSELVACGNPDALVVLADEGDADLIARPFRGPEPRLDTVAWARASRRLSVAAEIADEAGVGTTFHPHFGTYVEKASEIDRLIETTELSLCLDTGHLQIGGADPREYLARYADRVNHVHIKDVHMSVYEDARGRGLSADHPWWDSLACRLGEGSVDLGGFVSDLVAADYTGWLAIEQDRAPVSADTWESAVADQRHNVSWLSGALSASHGKDRGGSR